MNMTKRQLQQNITRTFESELESQLDAFNFDESEGGRRYFAIDTDYGQLEFEWSRTNKDVLSTEMRNANDMQSDKYYFAQAMEEKCQSIFDEVAVEQIGIYQDANA